MEPLEILCRKVFVVVVHEIRNTRNLPVPISVDNNSVFNSTPVLGAPKHIALKTTTHIKK